MDVSGRLLPQTRIKRKIRAHDRGRAKNHAAPVMAGIAAVHV